MNQSEQFREIIREELHRDRLRRRQRMLPIAIMVMIIGVIVCGAAGSVAGVTFHTVGLVVLSMMRIMNGAQANNPRR